MEQDNTTFTLRGVASPLAGATALPLDIVKAQRTTAFAPPQRGEATRSAEVNADDLVEVEFESGEHLWMRADEYRAQFGGLAVSRDARSGREVVAIPSTLPMVAPGLQSRDTRGAAAWVIKSLKVFGVDLVGHSALAIARMVEGKTTKDGKRVGLGLFRCALQTDKFALSTPTTAPPDGKPWLLFVHGTGSSTWGSFGELWSVDRREHLTALRAAYADRVLAFEHRSLSHSPIQNTLDLLNELARIIPGGGPLHVVTHSRGGLIGELLCRSARVADGSPGDGGRTTQRFVAPFSDEELELFAAKPGRTVHPDDAAALQELNAALALRVFPVERLVRVACPALGTTLASGRLDRWLSVIGTLANFLPDTPLAGMFADLGDFVAAVIKERTDPTTMPGLESMMPDSQCIKLVNWPVATVDSQLAVIAGDIDPGKWWARLAVWLTDRFYDGDHDLVVNTTSMYGGAPRARPAVLSLHKAETVNHFTYFREQRSAERLLAALTLPDDSPWPGFEPLRPPTRPIARAVARTGVTRPTVFVLPGIMGSELAIGERHIWINLVQLLRGGLADLALDAPQVSARQPVERYYGRVCEHLSATHHVVPFGYDWRLSIPKEADRLAGEVRSALDAARPHNQPVRFLAHSMGGLLVRAMIARHDAIWRELCAHPDARVVMLGTPNGGSYGIPELIVGQSRLFRKLARLDVRHTAQELLSLISRFPGVLAMLPGEAAAEFFVPETWAAYHQRAGDGWVAPDGDSLAAALAVKRLIDGSPIDPDRMIYVAGSADVTVAGLRLEPRDGGGERIVFQGTARGDGRVTWESGILPSLPTYYMDVEHGDLAAHVPSFAALDELLARGETRLLSRTPPVARAAAALFDMPIAEDDRYPDEDDLLSAALGGGTRARVAAVPADAPVEVRVVHGNLAFSNYPVAVGHYSGDTIVSAERHLDRSLESALSERLHLGIYPGPIETNAVFANTKRATNPYARPAGAIVVGLGMVGTLGPASLTRSFSRALLEYVIEERKRRTSTATSADERVRIATLLIGTGAGGMSVADSVYALIRGVNLANERLAAARLDDRIGEVEIVELYQDRALQALEALDGLSRRSGISGAFTLHDALVIRDGGLYRVTYEDEAAGWWHRLQILGGRDRSGAAIEGLRFASITRRARTEVRLLSTQRAVVDQFVERTMATTQHDQGVARTLFDLLVPNELKQGAPDQDDLVLLLDEEAARYPWELMENAEDPDRPPFVVEGGLLRQLEAHEFRESVRGTSDKSALVIGDPRSSYVELIGAQQEAEDVARTLQAVFTTVIKRVRPQTQEVITALFERPYKVLHLAGHGVYRYAPPESARCNTCGQQLPEHGASTQGVPSVTGMVIGDGVFLTPGEVAQMRAVPDLVFINCCHLGRIEAGRSAATPQELAFPKLAANLATEFIRMGVRAVVAAGWAVDDRAATSFATTFYQRLLDGERFGMAVKQAREETYRRHAGLNTWGAYQCYGDPDFRLVLERAHLAETAEPRYLSQAHALRDVGNIAARLKTESSTSLDLEVSRLDRIVKALDRRKWLNTGAINAALGRAFGEAGELERAVGYYGAALAAEDGQMTAKDGEQWANLMGRLAMRDLRASPSDVAVRSQATKALRRSIVLLQTLIGRGRRESATSERLALLGGACKRLAWIDRDKRHTWLARWLEYYLKAGATARARGTEWSYPVIQTRWALLVHQWQDLPYPPVEADLLTELAAIRAELDAREKVEGPQFWRDAMRVDCELIEAMSAGPLDKPGAKRIAERYVAFRDFASAREFLSVVDHLDFLIDMAEKTRFAKGLRELRQQIPTPGASEPLRR